MIVEAGGEGLRRERGRERETLGKQKKEETKKVVMGPVETCESAFPKVCSEEYYQINGSCTNNASLRF